MRSARSKTATVWPGRVSCCAAASRCRLRRGAPPRRSRTDNGDGLPGQSLRHLRRDPALVPCPVDDLDLDLLDRDGVSIDAENATGLARRGTQPPGELREVVRRVQPLDRLAPVVAPDQV